jgi:hypothetical protein
VLELPCPLAYPALSISARELRGLGAVLIGCTQAYKVVDTDTTLQEG